MRNRKLKDSEYNDQKKNDPPKKKQQKQQKNHDLLNITQKVRSKNTSPLKIGEELRCTGWVSNSFSIWDTRRVTVKRHEHHLISFACVFYNIYVVLFIITLSSVEGENALPSTSPLILLKAALNAITLNLALLCLYLFSWIIFTDKYNT